MKLALGIIGCGQIAGLNTINIKDKLNHASVYKSIKGIDLIAIADPDQEKLNQFSKIWSPKFKYTDYKKMIIENKLDIISICSPSKTHYEILKFSIKSGIKKIFCEKPACENIINLKKIISLSKNNLVSINYFRRWNKDIVNLKNNINNQKYGKIRKVTFNYSKSLLNNGLHLLDISLFLFGRPNKVKKIKKYKNIYDDGQKGFDFQLEYTNKNFCVNFNHIPSINYIFLDCEIFFNNNYIYLKERMQKIDFYKITKDKNFKNYKQLKLLRSIETHWKNSMTRAIKELITENKKNNISHNLTDSLNLFKIYEKISNK
ncbi:Gfo/Idh/MocA family oxidoreductase [Alphaproteobacteria bacterium]|jgi:predicted dehydrogenase|nr:Gfo/Idh/MocA family oxidoreductase [Alphaproteobacteria bacterium]